MGRGTVEAINAALAKNPALTECAMLLPGAERVAPPNPFNPDALIRWLDKHGVASNVCHWGNVLDKPTHEITAPNELSGDTMTTRMSDLLPANFGKPWTEAEDKALRDAFASGDSIKVLADRHSRTQSSCRLRLEKLGLIDAQEENSR